MLAFNIDDVPGVPAATQVASRLLVENMRAAAEEVRARYLTRQSEYPADWQAAAGETFSVGARDAGGTGPDAGAGARGHGAVRAAGPGQRPAGALPVRITLDLFPWFGPEEARAAAEGTPEEGMPGPGRPWRSGPLAVRSFRLLAGGQFASTIGDYCYAVALPWLVLSAHGGAILLGTVLACYGVPRTVLIPVGGVLADKVGPRTLMLAADAARCVLVAGLAVLAARHVDSLAALGPIAALIGAGEGLFIPASFAIMPSLLDGERLAAGNALSTAAVQAGSLLGPALGGALVAATRASTAAFAVDAASFGMSALTLLLIPRRPAAGIRDRGGREAEAAAEAAAEARGGCAAGRRAGPAAQVAGAPGHPGGGDRGQPGQRRDGRRRAARAGARQVRGGRLRRAAGLPRRRRDRRHARRGPHRRPARAGHVRLGRVPGRGRRHRAGALPGRGGRARRPCSAWSAPATAWATSSS